MKLRLHLVKACEVWIVDSLIEELKVELQYTQVTMAHEGFQGPANDIMSVRHDTWI